MNLKNKCLLTGLLCLAVCVSLICSMPQRASADVEIDKVLATTTATPVALKSVNEIGAATGTYGCSIIAYNWFDAAGQVLSGSFSTDNCRVEIQLAAADGFYFSEGLSVYLNNSPAGFTLDPGLKQLTLYREYTPDVWAPTVVKSPGGETVEIGEFASFVASATCADVYKWTLTSPDDKTSYSCSELPSYFPGVTTSDDGFEKMNIYNIPVEMDGWKIRCTFSGPGGSANSSFAVIRVNHEEEPSPSPSPTAAPTPSPAASPSADTQPTDGQPHEHDFPEQWSHDGQRHWHQCQCGQRSGEAEHSFEWAVTSPATRKAAGVERGICSVCGFITTRPLEYSGSSPDAMSYIIWGVGGVVALTLLALIISSLRGSRRRRRRRRRRR